MTAILQFLMSNPWLVVASLLGGFVLLIYGADWLVEGAAAVAKRFGMSNLVIGLTVVAFGTSMPELVVSVMAAIDHNTSLVITNVLGSNSINIFVVLGCTAMIYPVASQASCRKFDMPWSLLGGLLVLFFAMYSHPAEGTAFWGSLSPDNGYITAIGGGVLLVLFLIFIVYTSLRAKAQQETDEDEDEFKQPLPTAILLIVAGLAGLIVGGELIVRSATTIASSLGVSDDIIGLTIVALGTSLPELATSCIAAAKHNADLALGNVIGSNIFNIFLILGISACIMPLPSYAGLWIDALMVIVGSVMTLLFVMPRRHVITRWQGALLLIIYVLYMAYRLACQF